MKLSVSTLLLLSLLTTLFLSSGCQDGKVTEEQKSFLQAQIDATNKTLAEQKALEQAKLTNLNSTEEQKIEARKQLERIIALEKKTAQAQELLTKVLNPDGTVNIGASVAAVGGALPPPWNLLVLIGGPLVVGGIQELRRKQALGAATSLVNSIDAAMIQDPTIKAGFKNLTGDAKEEVRSQLTPLAKKLIDSESLT